MYAATGITTSVIMATVWTIQTGVTDTKTAAMVVTRMAVVSRV